LNSRLKDLIFHARAIPNRAGTCPCINFPCMPRQERGGIIHNCGPSR
jgi:hypothetical protein